MSCSLVVLFMDVLRRQRVWGSNRMVPLPRRQPHLRVSTRIQRWRRRPFSSSSSRSGKARKQSVAGLDGAAEDGGVLTVDEVRGHVREVADGLKERRAPLAETA